MVGKEVVGVPQTVDHREFTQTHAFPLRPKLHCAAACREVHGHGGRKRPPVPRWLSGTIQRGGLCCPQTKQDLEYGLDDGGEACVCVSVRKRKAPTPCFPRGINYSWRGGLSRRVPLGQSRSSSGFGSGRRVTVQERGPRPSLARPLAAAAPALAAHRPWRAPEGAPGAHGQRPA